MYPKGPAGAPDANSVGEPAVAPSRRPPQAVYLKGPAGRPDANSVGEPAVAPSRRPPLAVYLKGPAGGPDANKERFEKLTDLFLDLFTVSGSVKPCDLRLFSKPCHLTLCIPPSISLDYTNSLFPGVTGI